mgnify:CR=1 FL=1
MNFIEREDPEVWAAMAGEEQRPQDGLEMIASENYPSLAGNGTTKDMNASTWIASVNRTF